MPGGCAEGALKISIKSFYVPAHVIQARQFGGREQSVVQKRSNETAAAETVSMDENHPDREGILCVGIFDFAEVVIRARLRRTRGRVVVLAGMMKWTCLRRSLEKVAQ